MPGSWRGSSNGSGPGGPSSPLSNPPSASTARSTSRRRPASPGSPSARRTTATTSAATTAPRRCSSRARRWCSRRGSPGLAPPLDGPCFDFRDPALTAAEARPCPRPRLRRQALHPSRPGRLGAGRVPANRGRGRVGGTGGGGGRLRRRRRGRRGDGRRAGAGARPRHPRAPRGRLEARGWRLAQLSPLWHIWRRSPSNRERDGHALCVRDEAQAGLRGDLQGEA